MIRPMKTTIALIFVAMLAAGCGTLARGETAITPCTIDSSAAGWYARKFALYHRCAL